jgi:membrane-associated protease RseP (regulator of RpoE activity)
MLAGIAVNIVLAMAIIFGVAVTWGLPQTSNDPAPAVVAETMCTPTSIEDAKADDGAGHCEGAGPAADSGLKVGDEVTSVNGVDVDDFPAMVEELDTVGSDAASGGAVAGDRVTVPATVERNGQEISLDLQVEVVERQTQSGDAVLTGAIGMRIDNPNAELVDYNVLTAIPGTVHYSGYIVTETAKALVDLPARYWPVVESIFGADRADDSPVSVVGASRAGGELVQHDQWMAFLLLLANLNFFLAAFNLVPLPPMDGGHAIVVVYEKIRDWFRRRRGLEPGGPADYTRLLPVTYAVAAILLVFGLTVIVADVINPVQLF